MSISKGAKDRAPIRIFLSHSIGDIAHARKLRSLLAQRLNARVFTAEDLSAGEDWKSTLRGKLAEANAVVALLTPRSVHSGDVLHELGAAWALGKPLFAVITRREVLNSLPVSVQSAELAELDDLQNDEAADRFLNRLEDLMESAHVGV